MKHFGLFEGIGGFSLAARWMGWETVAWCEWNEFGQKVLRHHFPEAEGFDDITKSCFKKYANRIDIITGGFPCQPYSTAGKQLGTADPRHLWPEMLRAIREVKPKWVLGENVSGLVNWDRGLVFEQIHLDLEAEGYEVLPLLLPACSVAADHIRERIWFLAYSPSLGLQDVQNNIGTRTEAIYNTEGRRKEIEGGGKKTTLLDPSRNTFLRFQEMYGQPPVFNVDDGLPFELDGISVPKWIEETIKAGGNAIDPNVAYEIFKAIDKYNNPLNPIR